MNATERINILRDNGYKVNVRVLRRLPGVGLLARSRKTGGWITPPYPRGGRTEVSLRAPSDLAVIGIAECSPDDNFNRAYGLNLALGRAIEASPEASQLLAKIERT